MRRIKQQAGFTLFELIVVVVVIGLLMAASLKTYRDVLDDARSAGVEYLAGQFASLVAVIHLKWVVEGRPAVVEIEDATILMNSKGWPVGAQSLTEAEGLNSCQQLWQGLLKNAPLLPDAFPRDSRGVQYWAGRPTEGKCRYNLVTQSSEAYFFEYQAYNGVVKSFVGKKE